MKLKCVYSGIHYEVSHFPASFLNERYTHHPIFDIPQKELFQFARKWSAGELTDIDSYLFYLALLNSTEHLVWRDSARFTDKTMKIIHTNMRSLLHCIGKINLVTNPKFVFHKVCISKENGDLVNSGHWIENWLNSYNQFASGYKEAIQHDRVIARERAIQKLIRDTNKPISYYARQIAQWACMTGDFPQRIIVRNGKQWIQAEYWMDIIVRCCNAEQIFYIPERDIDDVIAWCEDYVDAGSDVGFELFRLLRSGMKKCKTYLGVDEIDFDDTHPGFKIITPTTSVEQANLQLLIDSAPKEAPVRDHYPSLVAYLRDKVKYDQAQKYLLSQAAARKIKEHIEEEVQDEFTSLIPNASDITEETLITGELPIEVHEDVMKDDGDDEENMI
mgnify:CR=1 FL=1